VVAFDRQPRCDLFDVRGLLANEGINDDLRRAFLIAANLSNADLNNADLSGAELLNADLTGANLMVAKNLDQQQLDDACGTDAKLPPGPPGLTLKPCPP
jgi:uncharacterized protein YjbI with pentapeptide repeats